MRTTLCPQDGRTAVSTRRVGVPRWLTAISIATAGIVAGAVVMVRMIDYKVWLRSQLTVPHGRGGRIAARAMPMFHRVFYGPAAERLDLGHDDTLLDVACGSGVFLDRFASDVHRVAGIDLSDIQIDLARRRLQRRIADGSAEIVRGDATHLPWENDTFTAAACVGSLDYFASPDAALREIHRVLQPGGRVVLTYGMDDDNEKAVAQVASWGLPQSTEDEARTLVEDAGFTIDEITYLSGDYPARYLHATKPA